MCNIDNNLPLYAQHINSKKKKNFVKIHNEIEWNTAITSHKKQEKEIDNNHKLFK